MPDDQDRTEVSSSAHLPERKHVSDEPEPRSVMRELLGDDADRFEVAPGRWYLPGTPP